MRRQSLQDVRHVRVPARVVRDTHNHLAARGRQGFEGMALWAGQHDGETFQVQTCIVPRQQGHRTAHGLAVTVSGDELREINLALYRASLRLVAQIHSHPATAYHSDTDDRYSMVTALGSLSIVAPDFATGPFEHDELAIYRLTRRPWWHFARGTYWRRMRLGEARELIVLEPN
jgi:hypothetical protein